MSLGLDIEECTKCANLQNNLTKAPIIYIGDSYKDVLLIGKSPHKKWLVSGSPFKNEKGNLSPSAKNIEKYLSLINLTLSDVALMEVSKCVVDDRNNLKRMMGNCSGYLARQINGLSPKTIILLGQKTVEAVSEIYNFEPKMLSCVSVDDREIILLYHPSPINPNNNKRNIEYLSNHLCFATSQ